MPENQLEFNLINPDELTTAEGDLIRPNDNPKREIELIDRRSKLCLITSVFNNFDFLELALESGIKQTFKKFIWFIINDGSTDPRVSEFLEDFQYLYADDFDIYVLDSSEKRGQAFRYNQAVNSLVNCEYVAYLDSDDISEPERLETQIEYLNLNPEVFCVGTWANVINEKGEKLEEYNYPPEGVHEIKDFLLENGYSPMLHPSVMYRRDTFLALEGYNLNRPFNYLCDDLDLWCRALSKPITHNYQLANIGDRLINYRRHLNSLSSLHANQIIIEAAKLIGHYRPKIIEAFQVDFNKSDSQSEIPPFEGS